MADDAKKVYRLYVLPMDAEGLKTAEKERFYRATPRYVLVYTDTEPTAKHAEITKDELYRLSGGDTAWLRDCNIVIVAEAMKENEQKIAGSMNRRLDAMEKALQAEAEKMKNSGEG